MTDVTRIGVWDVQIVKNVMGYEWYAQKFENSSYKGIDKS